MTKLYSTLAGIYHEMYQHIFDYDKEFEFYHRLLKSGNSNHILEIGCGTGLLAQRFLIHGYNYLGLDLYPEMLHIARNTNNADVFLQGDMQHLEFSSRFDAVLITGRSISYITQNHGIMNTFKGIHQSLKNKGFLIFDFFEANSLFDDFNDFDQSFNLPSRTIRRISHMEMNLKTGWTYDWQAKYIIEEKGIISEYDDITTLRAFTKDEMQLFMKLSGFKVQEITDKGKVITIVAEKNKIQE